MLNEDPKTIQPQRLDRMKEIVVNVFAIFLAAMFVMHPGGYTKPDVNAAATSEGPVGITVAQPGFGFNVIPGSERRIFATVTNGTSNEVTWRVKSGTATLSSTSGLWVDVTAGASGTTCSFTPPNTQGQYAVTSNTTFTIEATATDDVTKVADVTFNVCNPAVSVNIVPFYRTLYVNQPADVQSFIVGSVDQTVHWAITSQPSGGDGKLSDSTLRDTVFTATVAGRYILTATSNADQSKNSTAIMYVTGHAMPFKVTPNQTEPVDCTVDPAMLGKVYEVGPSQAFKTLASVPFPTMTPGSTVRVHNEDKTGLHPTEYHEYVQISQQATPTQPFRMCGVPDSLGNLPILDAANATGRSDTSIYAPPYGVITLHSSSNWSFWPTYTAGADIVVEGFHIRNARTGTSYTAPDGSTAQWQDYSAGLRINQGHNTTFVGNDVENCGEGGFTAFNTNGASYSSSDLNVLWEGNHFHANGAIGSYLDHQLYLQAWAEVVQFNRIDDFEPGADGANLKSRGVQSVIRYNYLGPGAGRQMDLVDVQDGPDMMSFEGFLSGGVTGSNHGVNPKDIFPADNIAAWQEAWHSHFVYGNIYLDKSGVPIHFSEDQSGGEVSRKGSLYWYNNTFHEQLCPECAGQKWTLFDTSAGGGSFLPHVEWQTIQVFNNVIWMDDPTKPVFQWNNYTTFIGVAGKNLITANWGSNNQTAGAGAGSGWTTDLNSLAYQGATNIGSHLTGFNSTNLTPVSTMPFDANTFILNGVQAGSSAVPEAICEMPARFTFLPSLGYAVPRVASPNTGATDTDAQTATEMNLVAGTGRYNTRYSNCR
jgi:hypothetical protein